MKEETKTPRKGQEERDERDKAICLEFDYFREQGYQIKTINDYLLWKFKGITVSVIVKARKKFSKIKKL